MAEPQTRVLNSLARLNSIREYMPSPQDFSLERPEQIIARSLFVIASLELLRLDREVADDD